MPRLWAPFFTDRIRSDAHVSRTSSKGDQEQQLPPPLKRDGPPNRHGGSKLSAGVAAAAATATSGGGDGSTAGDAGEKSDPAIRQPAAGTAESKEQRDGAAAIVDADGATAAEPKPNVFIRVYRTTKEILFCSVFNILLVFVPVGIILNYTNVEPYVVFTVNAIAIVPLAGMLAYATEAVALRVGDAMGALLNVTFGNATELIIFIIALTKNEIRIVQASLIGSILSNLLLILGMCFLFGGLRFREQIYNNTVTQMSACLLSLSMASLVLPTAFHASFSNEQLANQRVLQLSRGSSVILLLVYILYLLFQLKSHAYMYVSTPQHIIDEESHPGVLVNLMNSSSSSDNSSTSDTDSTGSLDSKSTADRIKRAFRRRRKSSVSSKDTHSIPSSSTTPHLAGPGSPPLATPLGEASHRLGAIASGDEADTDSGDENHGSGTRNGNIHFRDFEVERASSHSPEKKRHKSRGRKWRKEQKKRMERRHNQAKRGLGITSPSETGTSGLAVHDATATTGGTLKQQHIVAFTPEGEQITHTANEPDRRPFAVRTLSVRPTIPKILASTVFSTQNSTGGSSQAPRAASMPRTLRRTNSLPDRLNETASVPMIGSGSFDAGPAGPPLTVAETAADGLEKEADKSLNTLSLTSAVVLLVISTALVALCAEYLVGSINYMVTETPISEAFIGLILLPIVGNAAEHVTAVTVASKNKMDLAIGVAVGSSIQVSVC